MKKVLLSLFLLLVFLPSVAKEHPAMHYTVDIDTVGKYLNVTMQYVSPAAPRKHLKLEMPVWAPGYYVIVDFPKYLTDFRATRTDGTPLPWQKLGKSQWTVNTFGADTLLVSYRVYASERNVATSRIEPTLAFIAPNGVFLYEKGKKDTPVTVTFNLPSNWKNISTGLKPTAASGCPHTYMAPDFDVLYDSPLLLGNHFVDKFQHEGHPYEFALETPDGYSGSTFKRDFKAIVTATTALMRHVPYDNYCLIHLGKGGGGLEHQNSQACYTGGTYRFPSRDAYIEHLDFTAHEYFHLYNVKHIRPFELGPFDYQREVFTPLLWVSEGFTCYYSAQILRWAGLIDTRKQLAMYSEYIHDTEAYGGHSHMSLRQSSYDIWLNFFNTSANGQDVRISYYIKGPVMGLLFDAKIRTVTQGRRSLDDLMRLLYTRFDQQLGRGFTEEEFWDATREVCGLTAEGVQAAALLRHYVDTTADIDYASILSPVGLSLDTTTWQLSLSPSPSKEAKALRKAMLGE